MAEKMRLLIPVHRFHRLIDLRRRKRLTQQQVAQRMGVRQPRVSQLECADLGRVGVASLGAYVAALGGELLVIADFEGERLHLQLDGSRLRVVGSPRTDP